MTRRQVLRESRLAYAAVGASMLAIPASAAAALVSGSGAKPAGHQTAGAHATGGAAPRATVARVHVRRRTLNALGGQTIVIRGRVAPGLPWRRVRLETGRGARVDHRRQLADGPPRRVQRPVYAQRPRRRSASRRGRRSPRHARDLRGGGHPDRLPAERGVVVRRRRRHRVRVPRLQRRRESHAAVRLEGHLHERRQEGHGGRGRPRSVRRRAATGT